MILIRNKGNVLSGSSSTFSPDVQNFIYCLLTGRIRNWMHVWLIVNGTFTGRMANHVSGSNHFRRYWNSELVSYLCPWNTIDDATI
jgi:hypothetical protein